MGWEEPLTLAEVLKRHSKGPQTGVFTDGSARPNPGPGGWGFVHVREGKIINQGHGKHPDTTNNRMELQGLIEAYKSMPETEETEMFSDSNLCVCTVNQWAKGWEKNGWKRKAGPIANLELVKELWEQSKKHPKVTLKWIEAHNGWLWNEYADSLSTAWVRAVL